MVSYDFKKWRRLNDCKARRVSGIYSLAPSERMSEEVS